MEKFLQNLQEADKIIRTIDHMFYVTFPLVKDKKLLLKIILEAKTAIKHLINSILQYEYLFKRATLYRDPKSNFKTFQQKCSKRYNISEQEISLILELFDIAEKHKQSSFEFIKNNKVVILSEDMSQKVLTVEKTKDFLNLAKGILQKTKQTIKSQF
ncbi:MAG: hypothetical protein ACE5ES_06245 [Candidatus Nanoarchaeia archaeon]